MFQELGNDTVALTTSLGTVTEQGNGTWSWSYDTSDGADDSQTVIITATDSDGAETSVNFSLVVSNVAPTITVNEGETASNTGMFQELGNDIVALTTSLGTVTTNEDGTWSWSYDTSDGADDSQTVTITATDSDGAETRINFSLVVNVRD